MSWVRSSTTRRIKVESAHLPLQQTLNQIEEQPVGLVVDTSNVSMEASSVEKEERNRDQLGRRERVRRDSRASTYISDSKSTLD